MRENNITIRPVKIKTVAFRNQQEPSTFYIVTTFFFTVRNILGGVSDSETPAYLAS
jgi:hypothetical protein